MAMYVSSGGSGSGTTAPAAGSSTVVTLLTTPNVANTLYIVQVTWCLYSTAQDTVVNCVPLGTMQASSSHTSEVGTGEGCIFKVGPNIATKISFGNSSGNAASCAYAYNYIGFIMDTT